jgi:hypothetical protein
MLMPPSRVARQIELAAISSIFHPCGGEKTQLTHADIATHDLRNTLFTK